MKICCISDFHGQLNFKVPDCNLLLIAGDICGASQLTHQAAYTNGAFYKFLLEIKERINCPVVLVPGNHDRIFQEALHMVPKLPNCDVLIDKPLNLCGYKIYGTPWQPIFFDWAFNLSESELERKWSLIPDDTEILVLHGPPHGILDKNLQGEHCGSPSLAKRCDEVKSLKLVVFGHIHCSRGVLEKNGVIYVNAALCDEAYNLTGKPIIVEL